MSSRLVCVGVAALSLSLGFTAHGQAVDSVTLNLGSAGQNSDNRVQLTFRGKIYKADSRKSFEELTKSGATLLPEEKFVIGYVATNQTGDAGKIGALWNPSERQSIRKMMENKEAMERNTALFRNILESRLVGVMRYGQFSLVFVDHKLQGAGPYLKTYPVLVSGNTVYMTNQLSGDFFYEKLSSALAEFIESKIK